MYKAKIITVSSLEKHPNADRLQILHYGGLNFIVGMDVEIGQKMAIFVSDGQLSQDFCYHNNLYRDSSKNKDKSKTGFFEESRRVRVQPFRKVKSDGFACGLSAFDWCGWKSDELVDGYEFDRLNGKLICEKYITESTKSAIEKRKKGSGVFGRNNRVKKAYYLMEHYDTKKFFVENPPTENSLIIITEKIHGTSARTGWVKVENRKYPWYSFINDIFGKEIVRYKTTSGYDYVTGTRTTIVNERPEIIDTTSAEHYRWIAHLMISPLLRKGETVYYEIAGFTSSGSPIMDHHNTNKVSDPEFRKRYGSSIIYKYGCSKEPGENPTAKIFIYRITVQNDDGYEYELPWFQVQKRCNEMGLNTVPVLINLISTIYCDCDVQEIVKRLLNDGCSTVDHQHLMEGVCIRIENQNGTSVYKEKNFMFLYLEGVIKDDPSYIDIEEAS